VIGGWWWRGTRSADRAQYGCCCLMVFLNHRLVNGSVLRVRLWDSTSREDRLMKEESVLRDVYSLPVFLSVVAGGEERRLWGGGVVVVISIQVSCTRVLVASLSIYLSNT